MKKYLKKISSFMFAIAAACVLTLAIGEEAKAASAPVTKTTTMACSVWSAPATADGNKVKSIDAGYSVMVYQDVVQSTNGDGKTFYMTVKGNYILCKCFDDTAVSVLSASTVSINETAVVTTLKECSVWSGPATIETNRVKKVSAGYQVTVYTSVIESTSGDGKLFYQTTDGMYILCNCVAVNENSAEYVLNTNTMKFHYPNCTSANQIKEKNKKLYFGSSDEIIAMGYAPCKICNPK